MEYSQLHTFYLVALPILFDGCSAVWVVFGNALDFILGEQIVERICVVGNVGVVLDAGQAVMRGNAMLVAYRLLASVAPESWVCAGRMELAAGALRVGAIVVVGHREQGVTQDVPIVARNC